MAIKTADMREVVTRQVVADHWGLTGFIVKTPQDGGASRLQLLAESWTGSPGPDRGNVTPLRLTEYVGDDAIGAILQVVADLYDTFRAAGVPKPQAQYMAMRDALQRVKQEEGEFPKDAS